jgi:hypothetical protein
MTKTYTIENTTSGHLFGEYEGDTPEQAWTALLDDAGAEPQEPGDDILITELVTYQIDVSMMGGEWGAGDSLSVFAAHLREIAGCRVEIVDLASNGEDAEAIVDEETWSQALDSYVAEMDSTYQD